MDTLKLNIKYGPLEIQYEGNELFLKTELPTFLAKVTGLNVSNIQFIPANTPHVGQAAPTAHSAGNSGPLTTGTIAAKIGGASGSELAKAAAAQLMIFGGKGSFSRAELNREMKSATSYFKSSYTGNLTKILKSLVHDGVLLESSSGVYALEAKVLEELKTKLHG